MLTGSTLLSGVRLMRMYSGIFFEWNPRTPAEFLPPVSRGLDEGGRKFFLLQIAMQVIARPPERGFHHSGILKIYWDGAYWKIDETHEASGLRIFQQKTKDGIWIPDEVKIKALMDGKKIRHENMVFQLRKP